MKKLLFTTLLITFSFFTNAQWTQVGLDIDGEAANDESGFSVSMNAAGDRISIGAPQNGGNGIAAGHVRIYEWDSISLAWTQLGADIDGELVNDYSGWSVSMSGSGERLAIGAERNDGIGFNAGHVRVYEWNGTSWAQLGSDIDGEATDDRSGLSVSMNKNGDRIVIGAPWNDGSGIDAGHARIYEWDTISTAWVQLGADIDGEAADDRFGFSVSMSDLGDRVAIGAYANDGNGIDAGHARIYEWDSTAWVQLGTDIDGEATADFSANSVSVNGAGDRVAIGAYANDGNGIGSGHVRIYEWDSTTWVQLGADIDGEAANDNSGYSVIMNEIGDRVTIGALSNDDNGLNSGHVRIYEWDSLRTAWNQLGSDIDGDSSVDQSGYSVSMNAEGDRLAIGAPTNDGNGNGSGHVKVYEFGSSTSINEINTKNKFSIYPNPNNGNFTISVPSKYLAKAYQIFDVKGSLVKEGQFNSETSTDNLSSFGKGVYYLQISEEAILEKIVVY